jgi:hypothetical protein
MKASERSWAAGTGFIIGGIHGKDLLKREWNVKNLGQIYFFKESCAIVSLQDGLASRTKTLGDPRGS